MPSHTDLAKNDLPYALQVEFTSHCNLKCKMCPLTVGATSSSSQRGHMPEIVWRQVIDAANQIGLVIVSGFGEPLTTPQCLPQLQELDRLGIRMGVSTNGTMLTLAIARQLVALRNLIHINISIDSPDPVVYRKIRGGDIKKALHGVENLMSVIDDPQRVTISSVLMANNIVSLVSFPPILSKLGVKHYVLQGLGACNPELWSEHLLFYEKASHYFTRIREACDKAHIALETTCTERLKLELHDPPEARRAYFNEVNSSSKNTRRCCLPWELPFIDKDGKVFPCCYASYASTGSNTILGDLRESNLLDIWRGERYHEFRRHLFGEGTMPAVCRSCSSCSIVPIGEHPLRRYSAKIIFEKSDLNSQSQICLVVQNTGSSTWTQNTPIRIAPAGDRVSAFFHKTWLGPIRVCGFSERVVPPGGIATFRFQISSDATVQSEVFQLVVDGIAWLPNTRFEIQSDKTR